ncbi:hypothetical protein PR048_027122 [Dryococelus australis]|uniref:Uncharacterized protein n=1 Tax=Dryococelus australis TaxID=614101 RepID=A0ABQ9GG85_9NEOP|nr:hypothetical protein PR048_027122 [Dryococelus australis]
MQESKKKGPADNRDQHHHVVSHIPVEKFHYLVTSLEGEPLSLVTELQLTEDIYDLAWDTLTDRYQDIHAITYNSPQKLRQLLDTVDVKLGALKVMKFPVDEATKLKTVRQNHHVHIVGNDITLWAATSQLVARTTFKSRSDQSTNTCTALLHIKDVLDQFQTVKVSIDFASQSSFITEECALRLGLQCRKTQRTITSGMLAVSLPIEFQQMFSNMELADPIFHTPGAIDMLLGAELYPEVVDGGQIIDTIITTSFFVHTGKSLYTTIKQFSEVEATPVVQHKNPVDVKLPKEDCAPDLGVSHQQVLYRLPHLERQLSSVPDLKGEYTMSIIWNMKLLVEADNLHFQIIMWRGSPYLPVTEYKLDTVTCGVSEALYSAMCALRQLALDEGIRYTEAAKVLQNDIFVDYIVTGAKLLEMAFRLQSHLISLLQLGGLHLKKWSSSPPKLLESLQVSHLEVPNSFDEEGFAIMKNIKGFGKRSRLNAWSCSVSNFPDRFLPIDSIEQQLHVFYDARFANNVRSTSLQIQLGSLSVKELKAALTDCIMAFECLNLYTSFLDSEGVLRVGKRICHSSLQYGTKHPTVLLPKTSHFIELVIDHHHCKFLHTWLKATQAVVMRRFWILFASTSVCQSLMGDFPAVKVQQDIQSTHTGVDYDGPFAMRLHSFRGARMYKTYLSLF